MHQIYQQEENILSKLNSLLAMYRCLHFSQLCRIFPKLSIIQLTLLLKKLVRKGSDLSGFQKGPGLLCRYH